MCYVAINGCPHHNTLCPRCDFNLDLHIITVSPGHWVKSKMKYYFNMYTQKVLSKQKQKWGGHTGLWSIGRWYLVTKRENLKMASKLLCLMGKNIYNSKWTVSTLLVRIWEIYYWKFDRFTRIALTRSVFELEKCFFFKWVRISPEIDWYHYQGASPAPSCIVRHKTLIKTPTS